MCHSDIKKWIVTTKFLEKQSEARLLRMAGCICDYSVTELINKVNYYIQFTLSQIYFLSNFKILATSPLPSLLTYILLF